MLFSKLISNGLIIALWKQSISAIQRQYNKIKLNVL